MKRLFGLLVFASMIGMISNQADAGTITSLYNTGVDNSHAVLPDFANDSHWSIVSAPGGADGTQSKESGYPVSPNGPWVGNDNSSAWIIPAHGDSQGDALPGTYDFQTTFSLTGFIASTASITGQFSSDNELIDVKVNGISTGINNGTAFVDSQTYQHWWSLPMLTGLFQPGNNTLDFILTNDANSANPVGFRAELTGTAAVPEPSSLALLGLGGLGLAFGAYRRRRAAKV